MLLLDSLELGVVDGGCHGDGVPPHRRLQAGEPAGVSRVGWRAATHQRLLKGSKKPV